MGQQLLKQHVYRNMDLSGIPDNMADQFFNPVTHLNSNFVNTLTYLII